MTDLEKALCELERELNIRKKCYPRWIADGRMTKWEAIQRMEGFQIAYDIVAKLHGAEQALPEGTATEERPSDLC